MMVVRVMETGARGDGAASETAALQASIDRVAAAGGGTIEGHALNFMACDLGYIYEPTSFRPRLLCFYDCSGVRLDGVRFHDSPGWTVHLVGCEHVDINDITIDNNLSVSNCDCVIRSSGRGLVIQLRDQGNIENVHFSGFQIETRLFEHHYWGHAEPQYISGPLELAGSGQITVDGFTTREAAR